MTIQTELFDICQRKHGGNPQSNQAFEKIKEHLSGMQVVVYEWIRRAGDKGMTCDEISLALGRGENVYSGRITELRIKGKIRKDGVRKTRSGCNAAIWKAI